MLVTPSEITVTSVNEQFLNKCIALIEKNIDNELFGVQELSDTIGMSRVNVLNKLKKLTNLSPTDFRNTYHLKRVAELLKKQHANISKIAYMVGFQTPSAFNKAFKKQFGKTPTQYIKE